MENRHRVLVVGKTTTQELKANCEHDDAFSVFLAQNIDDGCVILSASSCDCVLIESELLPQHAGDALNRLAHTRATAITPVIVIVGDAQCGQVMIEQGASDYLLRGEIASSQFVHRVLTSAVARQRWQDRRSAADRSAIKLLEKQAPNSTVVVACANSDTAAATESGTIQTKEPEHFRTHVVAFAQFIDECFDEHVYRVPHRISTKMSEMAAQLVALRAGPRDVVEIYGSALKLKLLEMPRARAGAYSEIGQLLALELMGYLASQYRNLARIGNGRLGQ